MSENPRRCPFCGSDDLDNDGHYVRCCTCHATGPEEPVPDAEFVTIRWNRRPLETASGELIECLRERKLLPDCDWPQTIRELRAAIREGNQTEIDLLLERVEEVKI